MTTTINGKDYELSRLDIFQEFDLSSKLSPVLAIMALQNDRGVLEKTFARSFTAMCTNMDTEMKNEVLSAALVGVRRKDGDGWAPIFVNGRIMYQDINMDTVLKLLWQLIINHKMLDFFATAPSSSQEQAPAQQPPTGSGPSEIG